MSQLFGTDGIRGNADGFPFDSETIWIIGRTLAEYFGQLKKDPPNFIVGRDTRESGERIEAAFASGVVSAGGNCDSAGVITTPGVAYLTGSHAFDAGIVISASHNSFEDNGLKVFSPTGQKLGREVEQIIEAEIEKRDLNGFKLQEINSSGSKELQSDYLGHFRTDFGGLDLSGVRIVADCANGAASHLAPLLFESLGASVIAIHNKPDGRNINLNCGSLHLESLQEEVLAQGADFGVAFDGDADRSLFVNEKGGIVDGDSTLWIMAKFLNGAGKLRNRTVVATVMSNIGLEIALRGESIELTRTDVGDKHVLSELLSSGASIGGEQSGHIIFPTRSLVGDGMQTALYLLLAMSKADSTLSELESGFETYPQILVNVPVRQKVPFDKMDGVSRIKDEIEAELDSNGRLLLRYSGTENLARVMIEGESQEDIEIKAGRLAEAIRNSVG